MTLTSYERRRIRRGRHRAPGDDRHAGPADGQAAARAVLRRRDRRARRRGLQLPARRRRRHEHRSRASRCRRGSTGYGDFVFRPTSRTLRRVPVARAHGAGASPTWSGRTARRWPPRRARSCAASSSGWPSAAGRANVGSELEFILFRDSYDEARAKRYRDLRAGERLQRRLLDPRHDDGRGRDPADPAGHGRRRHLGRGLEGRVQLRPARGQLPLLRRAAPWPTTTSIYKNGAKEIACQHGCALTFMAKYDEREGNSCHIHCSFWDDDGSLFPAADGHGCSATVRALHRRPARRHQGARPTSSRPT